MWSPHCTRAALVVLAIALTGCASGPGGRSGPGIPPPAKGERVSNANVPDRAMTMYEQATAAMAAGDRIEAQLRFREFVLQYPDYPGAYVNLAILEVDNGHDEKARRLIDAALDLDPDYAPALNQRGMLLRRNGDFSGAESAYLKAVTVSPDYALAHYNLGVLNELYLKRLDLALTHFERYQALVGDDRQVDKWIADLRRRVAATQRTANVAE